MKVPFSFADCYALWKRRKMGSKNKHAKNNK